MTFGNWNIIYTKFPYGFSATIKIISNFNIKIQK